MQLTTFYISCGIHYDTFSHTSTRSNGLPNVQSKVVSLASGQNNAFDVDVSYWVHSCLSLLFHFRPGRRVSPGMAKRWLLVLHMCGYLLCRDARILAVDWNNTQR